MTNVQLRSEVHMNVHVESWAFSDFFEGFVVFVLKGEKKLPQTTTRLGRIGSSVQFCAFPGIDRIFKVSPSSVQVPSKFQLSI